MSQSPVLTEVERKIYFIRGIKVMLDRDLAKLYGVSTKRLNEQVRRNAKRFPDDFMFFLDPGEMKALRSQNTTLERGRYSKYRALAFTEQGIAMLSGVLNSDRAIQVNIAIMRAFVKLRELMITHKDLARKIEELEVKFRKHDENFVIVFQAIRKLLESPKKSKKKIPIGFGVR
jgi:hypothetical protein